MSSAGTARGTKSTSSALVQGPSPVAWRPSHTLDAQEWAVVGRRMGGLGRCIQWLLGDWIIYGNERFGERYSRASKITGYDTQTLMNMVYVASHFPISRRRERLSWSHHETLASLASDEQDYWLDQAARHRWSVADLRAMLRLSRKERQDHPGGDEDDDRDEGVRAGIVKCPRCGEKFPLG